jgi:hypothetical protein
MSNSKSNFINYKPSILEGPLLGSMLLPSIGITLLLVAIITLACFQLSVSSNAEHFVGFKPIEWQTLDGCRVGGLSKKIYGASATLNTHNTEPKGERLSCLSHSLSLDGPKARLYFLGDYYRAGRPNKSKKRLRLLSESGERITSRALFVRGTIPSRNVWEPVDMEIPEQYVGKRAFLILEEEFPHDKDNWVALRNKIDFFSAKNTLEKLQGWAKNSSFRPLFSPLASISLCLLLLLTANFKVRSSVFLAVLFFVAFCVHYRAQVFIYFDEWHVLEHLSSTGFTGALYRHNEHFLPLFFAWYWLEALIFGDRYLLWTSISIAIHACNALLLYKLLFALYPQVSDDEATSAVEQHTFFQTLLCRSATLLFLVCGLHSEALHWAFEQSLLFAQLFTFLSFLFGISYFQKGKRLDLFCSGLFAALAPLLFGNGFIVLPQLGLILCLCAVQQKFSFGLFFKRSFLLMLSGGLLSLLTLAAYLSQSSGAGHSVDDVKPFEEPEQVKEYIEVGSQVGTILRGLSIVGTADGSVMKDVYRGSFFRKLYQKPVYLTPELYLAYCGGVLNLLMLIVSLLTKRRKELGLLWLVGNIIVISSLILPALARWHYGVQQSLSPRYHYGSLLGLYMILIASWTSIISLLRNSGKLPQRLASGFLVVLCAWACSRQMNMGANATWFTEHGLRHRTWIAQARDWEAALAKVAKGQPLGYYADKTPLADLQPEYTPGITPGRGPRDIYRVLSKLDRKQYPNFKHLQLPPETGSQ